VEAEEGIRPLKVVTFGKRQGGSGATTISFNAALWMIKLEPPPSGKRYVFVEADFGRQSALWLFDPEFLRAREEDPDSHPTLREFLMGSAEPRELLVTSERYPEYRDLSVVAAGSLTMSDKELMERYDRYLEKLDELMDFLNPISHRIVVDGPGAGGLSGLRDYYLLTTIADLFVPVVEPNKPSIDDAQALIDLAVTVGTGYACYVLNKYEDRHSSILRVAEEELAAPPLETRGFLVRYDEMAKRTYDEGKPLVLFAPHSPASQDIKRIAEFLLRVRVKEEYERPSRKGRRLLEILRRLSLRKLSPSAIFKPLRKGRLETRDRELEEALREIEKMLEEM